jgi:hypothetical protein
VFANLQHRPTPPTALPFSSFLAAALLPRRSDVEIEAPPNLWRVDPDPVGTFKRSNVSPIYPFCPQTLADLPTQRPQPNPFEINAFRTLFLATEGYTPSSHFGTHLLLMTITQALLFMHLREPILQPLSFQMRAGMGGYTLPCIRRSYVSTFRRRSDPVTGSVSRASQVQSGCWPPLYFFKVTDGHAPKQDHFVSRVPVPFPSKEFQVSTQLAKSVEWLPAVPGILGVNFDK